MIEDLYQQSRSRLQSVAARYVGQDAEDLVHDAFVKVLHSAETFRGESRPTTWLHQIVVNACVDHCRRRSRRKESRVPSTDVIKSRLTVCVALKEAILGLSHDERRSYILHDLLGYTHREIEERYGIPIGTSKSRVWRAHRNLRLSWGKADSI